MTMIVITTLLAVPTERATSSGAAVSHEVATAVEARRAAPECVPPLRLGVVGRRTATWGHQDNLGRPRTKTARRARTATSCAYLRWIKRTWATRADKAWRAWTALSEPKAAICHVFGAYCDQALSVSWCESKHNTNAGNGQYLGLFQMGESERRLYGHGPTALEQAEAAKRYFDASGRDWSPWQCRPGGGLAW